MFMVYGGEARFLVMQLQILNERKKFIVFTVFERRNICIARLKIGLALPLMLYDYYWHGTSALSFEK